MDLAMKARTLRLPEEISQDLEAMAAVDEVSVNAEIVRAISSHLAARRRDAAFRRRLKASMKRNREILDRLAR
jgi:ribosomal protein S15P/S13E